MKKILIISLMFFSFNVNAQTDTTSVQTDTTEVLFDSVEVKTIELPDSTAIGLPDGKLISKEMGPEGGRIISDDRRVELIFPEGALTSTTNISIQPVTHSIPNGNGKAYQFEPSGLHFAKAVQLIFHYTENEAETCPPYLRFLAIQSANGKWEYINYESWDSATNSSQAFISHFSAYLDGNEFEMDPVKKTLKVGESFELHLTVVVAPGEDELPPLGFPGKQIKWSVKGGGTITRSRSAAKWIAKYQAPKYLPPHEPKVVLKIDTSIIRVVVQRSRHWKGTTRVPTTKNLAEFTCDIKLYDEYKITVIKIIVKDGTSVLECGAGLEDTSSFKVRLYSGKVEVSEEINMPPTLKKPPTCKPVTYDNVGCEGPVDIRRNRLTGFGGTWDDTGIMPPEIRIEFLPGYVKIVNRHGKFPGELHEQTEIRDATVANEIRFRANGKHQGPFEGDECQLIIEPL